MSRRPDDTQADGRPPASAGENCSADMLMEQGEGRRTEHHLLGRVETVPGQKRRAHRGVRVFGEGRYGLSVELNRPEVHAGPVGDRPVVVEQIGSLCPR